VLVGQAGIPRGRGPSATAGPSTWPSTSIKQRTGKALPKKISLNPPLRFLSGRGPVATEDLPILEQDILRLLSRFPDESGPTGALASGLVSSLASSLTGLADLSTRFLVQVASDGLVWMSMCLTSV
jgi:hypothetical protein